MKRRMMKMAVLFFLISSIGALAWQPTGWCYMNWPYAYSVNGMNWHYFQPGTGNYGSVQVVNLSSSNWFFLGRSLLSGEAQANWAYFRWPYAYCTLNGNWYYFSQSQTQWSCLLSNGDWSVLGDKGSLPLGNWNASSPDVYALSVTVNDAEQIAGCYLKVHFDDGWYTDEEAWFEPYHITWDGSSFTAIRAYFTSDDMGDWTEQYQISGTVQPNGSITGTWYGYYYWDPTGAFTPKTNTKSGAFTAWR